MIWKIAINTPVRSKVSKLVFETAKMAPEMKSTTYPAEVLQQSGNFVMAQKVDGDAQDGHQHYRSEQHVFPHGKHQLFN